ncbi:zinc ribbon domain-containing protein [Pseudodesulfovibrio sp. JC047]|uniref:FmdB family zinc ribbon protein n=1 Tax=Pseudodesulfovibrio sp. JC047 TaxID=2683199 RepID=UPI0013D758EE|nr:zinc ribbon domain-containing protein [Pseudodesulfovibrio sp. JC047]NDV20397.1 zinc ribbon domain-containing protein [Pseudodesulfovibrio sp. JC047]
MPIFEYKCSDCGHEFEELVFDRDECPPCPKCQSANTGKLMSAVRSKVNGGASAPAANPGGGDSGPSFSATSPCSGCSGGDCSNCG